MPKKSEISNGTININTQNVRACVNALTSINNGLENDFSSVKTAISNLDGSWNSFASTKAISKFNKIKSDFCGSTGRKAVMDNYIKFLQNAVASDYESTEQTNINLSELFK